VRLECRPERFCLTIEDSGPGMEPAALSWLGERFFHVPDNSASGSGLGWSIAQRVAAPARFCPARAAVGIAGRSRRHRLRSGALSARR
jgi:hypothetical protein